MGAGYYIALSDLDIRGAGSLFGYKQSGDGGVGFELYTDLLMKAVEKFEYQRGYKLGPGLQVRIKDLSPNLYSFV